MAVGFFPVFEPTLEGVDLDSLGEVLATAFEELEELAEEEDITPLSAFGDNREIPDDFDGDPEELDELLGPFDDWFDPGKGATALSVLAECVEENADDITDAEAVVEELREVITVLTTAKARKAKFRFEMSS